MINSARTFTYFLLSSALSLLSIQVFLVAMPLIVFELGYSSVEAGWCSFAFYLPVVFSKILAGPVIESNSKRNTLLLSSLSRAVVAGVGMTLMYIVREDRIFFIVPISFVFGLLSVFTDIAEPGALKLLLAQSPSTSMLSKYEVRTRAVQMIGPTICGFLVSCGAYAPLLFTFIFSLIPAVMLKQVRIPNDNPSPRLGLYRGVRSAFSWIVGHGLFMVMTLLTASNNFIHPILYLTIIYQIQKRGLSSESIGLVLSGLGVGGVIGSLISAPLLNKFKFRHVVIGINTCRIIVFLGFALLGDTYSLFILFVLKAVLGGIWNVCYSIFYMEEIPQDFISRVSSLSDLVIKILTALGSLLAGYLIWLAGVSTTLWFLVACTIGMLLCSMPFKSLYPGESNALETQRVPT